MQGAVASGPGVAPLATGAQYISCPQDIPDNSTAQDKPVFSFAGQCGTPMKG